MSIKFIKAPEKHSNLLLIKTNNFVCHSSPWLSWANKIIYLINWLFKCLPNTSNIIAYLWPWVHSWIAKPVFLDLKGILLLRLFELSASSCMLLLLVLLWLRLDRPWAYLSLAVYCTSYQAPEAPGLCSLNWVSLPIKTQREFCDVPITNH